MIGYPVHPSVAEENYLKLAQLMLTGNTVDTFSNYLKYYRLNEVVFHESYYYTITRYPLLSEDRKRHMLRNAHHSMFFPMSAGMVLHTSSPFPKDLLSNLMSLLCQSMDNVKRGLAAFHKTGFFAPVKDTARLLKALYEKVEGENKGVDLLVPFLREFYVHAADLFYTDYRTNYAVHPTARVLLENNVQLPIKNIDPMAPGRVAFLSALYLRHPDLYSLCLDEEHAYATGDFTIINYKEDFSYDLKYLTDIPNSLYHFNTIPKNVAFASFKDRHSETTLKESKVPFEAYQSLIKALDEKGIRAIREINSHTFPRELEFISETTNIYSR